MGLFDYLYGKPHHSEIEVKSKLWAGVKAYQAQEYTKAAQYFTEYFDMKGYGNFPTLDADDNRMYMNLLMSQFFAQQYTKAIRTSQKLLSLEPNFGEPYSFYALCELKLGNRAHALELWKQAAERNAQIVSMYPNIDDVKINTYN